MESGLRGAMEKDDFLVLFIIYSLIRISRSAEDDVAASSGRVAHLRGELLLVAFLQRGPEDVVGGGGGGLLGGGGGGLVPGEGEVAAAAGGVVHLH